MSKRPLHPPAARRRTLVEQLRLLLRGQELVTGASAYTSTRTTWRPSPPGRGPGRLADYLEAFAPGMPPHQQVAIGLAPGREG